MTWTATVFPIFDNGDKATSGCTTDGCHATKIKVLLPSGDPDTAWTELTGYKSAVAPGPYLDTAKPQSSWMMCNLRGTLGTGMPLGGTMSEQDLATIATWLGCGAPK